MTASSDVDDAMNAVLGPGEEVSPRPAGEVAAPGEGPCSEAEAEQLVERAINAAETFYDTVVEIIRRQAWVPLGYANPRDLMLRRLGGTTVNPVTGKPYSRSHVHRMARVSWMLWAISDRTGVDPGDLTIPERTLRELGGGMSGDLQLVDTISDRVAAAIHDKDASPDTVQDVIDSALSDAAGGSSSTVDVSNNDEFDEVDGRPDDHSASDGGSGSLRDGRGGEATGSDTFDAGDDDEPDAPPTPLTPAIDAFDVDGGFDDEDAAPIINASDALSQMRANANYTRHLQDIKEIAGHLPEVTAVEKQLPQFLDIVDDDELDEFKELLEQTRSFVDRAQKAKEAIDAVIAATDDRLDFV
ncbi:hypothetical protein [Dietzia sp. 179-F 9C3 NHS]|uniref:hypothetical protein n=1 Tax=Dietzia sp. 179-F 9C3 NHS TaxID=3374295 RepID=UPI0038793E43